jgi:hypothetical protein
MIGFIVTALIILAVLALRRRFSRPAAAAEVINGTRVLVSSLGRESSDGSEDSDAEVYSNFYRRVSVLKAQKTGELLASVRSGDYDVVHLFCEIDEGGRLAADADSWLSGSELLDACREGDVKLLFIANDNPGEGYLKAFSGEGISRGLDFVSTINRNGESFGLFLEGLLRKMSSGETLPVAWVSLAPQIPGGEAKGDQPGLYCSISRAARLMP